MGRGKENPSFNQSFRGLQSVHSQLDNANPAPNMRIFPAQAPWRVQEISDARRAMRRISRDGR